MFSEEEGKVSSDRDTARQGEAIWHCDRPMTGETFLKQKISFFALVLILHFASKFVQTLNELNVSHNLERLFIKLIVIGAVVPILEMKMS